VRVVFLSLAVHAVAFALVLRTPRRERVPPPAPLTAIEIVEDEPPRSSSPSPPLSSPSEATSGERAASVSEATSVRAPSRGMAIATSEEGATAAPSGGEPTPAPVWTGSFFTPAPQDIAIGGANPFLPSSAAPLPEEKKKPNLGLRFGPASEGPALVVLRDVTSRSLAPLNGRARFTVRANAEGEVLGIDIDESTGGPGWDDARNLALEGLKGKKIVVPRGARGINMRFEIVSEVTYPSGQKTPGELKIQGLGGVLPDESNIGQSPTRKIHTRHIDTEIL
jgi:hypothetical protein